MSIPQTDLLTLIQIAARDIPVLIVTLAWIWAQNIQNSLGIQVLPKYTYPVVIYQTKNYSTKTVNFPQNKLEIASPSAILDIPKQTKEPTSQPVDNTPWGTTEKVGEHLYRTYVGTDPAMGTPQEILEALNFYRSNHHVGNLRSDEKLCQLAQKRATEQDKAGSLDSHKGLNEYMQDTNRWKELDITAIGENSSYGYVLSGVHLIEWVFDADEEHKDNQLKPEWNLGCAAITGVTVDIVFGKR